MTPGIASQLRAEIFRVRRQRSNWLLPILPIAGLLAVAGLTASNYGLTSSAGKPPLTLARDLMDTTTLVMAMTLGVPVLVLGARAAAQDYQYGTVRLLIASGAGRVRLLGAKAGVTLLGALVAFVVGCVAVVGAVGLSASSLPHGMASLPTTIDREMAVDTACLGISLLSCAVLGVFTSSLSRSLTFGLTAAMVWFPSENVLTGVLFFLSGPQSRGTTGSFASDGSLPALLSGLMLAPELNHMLQALQPWRATVEMAARPLLEVSPAHALGVVSCWLAIFALAAIAATVLRYDIRN